MCSATAFYDVCVYVHSARGKYAQLVSMPGEYGYSRCYQETERCLASGTVDGGSIEQAKRNIFFHSEVYKDGECH